MLGQHAPALPGTHLLSSLDRSHPITALRPCPLGVPAGTPPPSAPLTPNPPSSNGLCGAEGGAASGSRVGLQHTLRSPVDKKQGEVFRPGGAGWHRAASAPGRPGTGRGPAAFTAARPKGAGVSVCEDSHLGESARPVMTTHLDCGGLETKMPPVNYTRTLRAQQR